MLTFLYILIPSIFSKLDSLNFVSMDATMVYVAIWCTLLYDIK